MGRQRTPAQRRWPARSKAWCKRGWRPRGASPNRLERPGQGRATSRGGGQPRIGASSPFSAPCGSSPRRPVRFSIGRSVRFSAGVDRICSLGRSRGSLFDADRQGLRLNAYSRGLLLLTLFDHRGVRVLRASATGHPSNRASMNSDVPLAGRRQAPSAGSKTQLDLT